MPPKKGGGVRGRKKNEQDNSRTTTPTTNTTQRLEIVEEKRQITNIKNSFEVAPLIVEVESFTKVRLNLLIKNHLPDVKVSNIQVNRPNGFTIYPKDVKSFNQLLNELSTIIKTKENQPSVVYIPRSIQRIMENNKEAFVKKIDLEITDDDVKRTLEEQGFKYEKISRLTNKEKILLKTVKITFIDSLNRDLFVKHGLQIDSMYFTAEPAHHNNKPSQCYKCFKYGHVAKYCRAENQICSRCGGANHKFDNCPNSNQQPMCCNCKGEHTATSSNCPKFKDYQQKIQKTIDQYSSSSTKQMKLTPTCLDWNNLDEFPALRSTDKIDQSTIIETITEKIMQVVEKATRRIFEILNQKFESLANQLGQKFNIEIEELIIGTENTKQKTNDNQRSTTAQHQTTQEQPTEETQNEDPNPTLTPINGIKRKYIPSSSSSEKPANTTSSSRI
jgi:hypothetical protein